MKTTKELLAMYVAHSTGVLLESVIVKGYQHPNVTGLIVIDYENSYGIDTNLITTEIEYTTFIYNLLSNNIQL